MDKCQIRIIIRHSTIVKGLLYRNYNYNRGLFCRTTLGLSSSAMSSKVQPREKSASTTKIESRVGPETKFFVNRKGKQIHCSYWRPNDSVRLRWDPAECCVVVNSVSGFLRAHLSKFILRSKTKLFGYLHPKQMKTTIYLLLSFVFMIYLAFLLDWYFFLISTGYLWREVCVVSYLTPRVRKYINKLTLYLR